MLTVNISLEVKEGNLVTQQLKQKKEVTFQLYRSFRFYIKLFFYLELNGCEKFVFSVLTSFFIKMDAFYLASIYIACIVGGFSVNGSIPLLYELTIEITYPVPETASIGMLSVVNNVFTFGFLLSLNMPGIGKSHCF